MVQALRLPPIQYAAETLPAPTSTTCGFADASLTLGHYPLPSRMEEQGYQTMPLPIATMDPLAWEILAACHAEAHRRAVEAGRESVACKYCGQDYESHVWEGAYCWRVRNLY